MIKTKFIIRWILLTIILFILANIIMISIKAIKIVKEKFLLKIKDKVIDIILSILKEAKNNNEILSTNMIYYIGKMIYIDNDNRYNIFYIINYK